MWSTAVLQPLPDKILVKIKTYDYYEINSLLIINLLIILGCLLLRYSMLAHGSVCFCFVKLLGMVVMVASWYHLGGSVRRYTKIFKH